MYNSDATRRKGRYGKICNAQSRKINEWMHVIGIGTAVISGSSLVVCRCTRACTVRNSGQIYWGREETRGRGASQLGNNRGEKSERNEKRGRGRTARNIHLEYRRRRTGCGLTRNAHLEKIALPCVKRNPLWFLRLFIRPFQFPFCSNTMRFARNIENI